jgi:hypothetical protein
MTTRFDAGLFARAWLAVGVAASKDKARPQLDRTTLIELYPEGARLVATDGVMLLTAFVPEMGRWPDEEPGIDVAPVATAIAQDPSGRARSLLGHLLGLSKQAEADELEDDVELRLSLGVLDDGTGMLDGFAIPWVVLDYPDHERLKLRTYEGTFPQWRPVLAGFKARTTKSVILNGDIIGRLAKVPDYIGGPIQWRFGGADAMALVDVHDDASGLSVSGAVMSVSAAGEMVGEEAAA